jgi:hypothetical protein
MRFVRAIDVEFHVAVSALLGGRRRHEGLRLVARRCWAYFKRLRCVSGARLVFECRCELSRLYTLLHEVDVVTCGRSVYVSVDFVFSDPDETLARCVRLMSATYELLHRV